MKENIDEKLIAIQSLLITTIVYTLLVPEFFKMDSTFGDIEYFVDDDANNKTMLYSQQIVMDTKCKSPCPSTAEMCIAMYV